MSLEGVILYGPPASGKDTITTALASIDSAIVLFRRLKSGPGRTAGYRMTSRDYLADLRLAGQIVWENARYGATYVVDRPGIQELLDSAAIPVIHLGQPAAVDAVRNAFREVLWTTVELWCPRDVAHERIKLRGTGDTDVRLAAWDDTPHLSGEQATLRVDTAEYAPTESAKLIYRAMKQTYGKKP